MSDSHENLIFTPTRTKPFPDLFMRNACIFIPKSGKLNTLLNVLVAWKSDYIQPKYYGLVVDHPWGNIWDSTQESYVSYLRDYSSEFSTIHWLIPPRDSDNQRKVVTITTPFSPLDYINLENDNLSLFPEEQRPIIMTIRRLWKRQDYYSKFLNGAKT